MGTGRVAALRRGNQERTDALAWLPHWFIWLPPLLIAATLALELATPDRFGFSTLLTAAVLVGALVYRAPYTATVGALSLLIMGVVHFAEGDLETHRILNLLLTMAIIALLSTVLAAVQDRVSSKLIRIEAVAEAAQLALLRPLPPRLGNVQLAGFYRAAGQEALIGGDLYSVRDTRFGVRVIVGDVRGKGLGATETVSTVISAFREAAMVCPALPDIVERIESAMALDRIDHEAGASRAVTGGDDGHGEELFATAVLLEFSADDDTVRLLDCGHPPPMRVTASGAVPVETEYGLPLGLNDLDPSGSKRTGSFSLAPGDVLVAYSDGLSEARNSHGEFYPVRDRLDAYAGRARETEPHGVVDFLEGDVLSWAHRVQDDIVVLVMQQGRGAASGASPGPRVPEA